jgi:hypothetical protein
MVSRNAPGDEVSLAVGWAPGLVLSSQPYEPYSDFVSQIVHHRPPDRKFGATD